MACINCSNNVMPHPSIEQEAFSLQYSRSEMRNKQTQEPSGKTHHSAELLFRMKKEQTKGHKEKHSLCGFLNIGALNIDGPTKVIRPAFMTALDRLFVGSHHYA